MRRQSGCRGRESEIVVAIDPGATFHYLLGHPLGGRERCHCYMQDFPIDMPHHEKHVQCLEQDGGDAEESRTPICWIRAASGTVARSRTARDCGASPYIW